MDKKAETQDVYKIEQGAYEFQPEDIDIAAITLNVANQNRTYASKRGIQVLFEAPDDCHVYAEELLCFSMLSNLVRYSIDASSERGVVKIVMHDEERVDIEIHNESVISEEALGLFFEKYTASTAKSNSSFGNYSAYLMANVQGCDLKVRSEDPDGTTIRLSLPKQ